MILRSVSGGGVKKKIMTETRFELAPTFVDQDCYGKGFAVNFSI